jgi:hypothetical protein
MENGVVELTTRVCLSYYLERQFGLDSGSPMGNAQRQQIVLVNRDDLEAARTEVGEACGLDPTPTAKDED